VAGAVERLPICPRPFWEFAVILNDYTSQDVFEFIFFNFFSMALEDPFDYKLTTRM